MINSDYIYKFVNKLNFKDITFFVISFLVISFTLKFIRILSDWLSKKFTSKRMLIFAWVPLIHFSLYFSGLFISFYIIFAPSREFLIGFIIIMEKF